MVPAGRGITSTSDSESGSSAIAGVSCFILDGCPRPLPHNILEADIGPAWNMPEQNAGVGASIDVVMVSS